MSEPEVIPFEPAYTDSLCSMLSSYYNDDCRFRLTEERIAGICQDLLDDGKGSGLCLYLLTQAGIPDGFCTLIPYAASSPDDALSGWILLRDFFIRPEKRRKSLGTFLFHTVAGQYQKAGARGIYLTASPPALPFWQSLGFLPYRTDSEYVLSRRLS